MATPWSDAEGRPVDGVPEPPAEGSYYEPIGDFQGAHYERNAFATGTTQEVAALVDLLALEAGQVVVDVGCGTARHLRALAGRGIHGVGIDISGGLIAAARDLRCGDRVALVHADARAVPLPDALADAVLCLCQGGFGITPGGDLDVLGELARLVRPGGRVAVTGFSLAFAARHLTPGDAIDLARGIVHTCAEVRGPDGARRSYDLWTTCYTPAHLRTLVEGVGLVVEGLSGIEPGAYGTNPPTLDHPEILVLARRPWG